MPVTGFDIGQSVWDFNETVKRTKYSNEAANANIAYTQGLYNDNTRYWERYLKKHHIENREVMFPFRSGYNFNMAPLYTAEALKVSNEQQIGDAVFRIAKNLTKFLFSDF